VGVAGLYNVDITFQAAPAATLAQADGGNLALQKTGVNFLTLPITSQPQTVSVIMNLLATDTLGAVAIVNATAATEYTATIVATRILP
jgi:hypothetical protein